MCFLGRIPMKEVSPSSKQGVQNIQLKNIGSWKK